MLTYRKSAARIDVEFNRSLVFSIGIYGPSQSQCHSSLPIVEREGETPLRHAFHARSGAVPLFQIVGFGLFRGR